MRSVFLLLVAANLLFFSWALGHFGEPVSGREPQRLVDQLHPESIHLVGAQPPTVPVALLCKRLSGFATPLAAEALKNEFGTALGGTSAWAVNLVSITSATEFWVGITGLATKALAEKKRNELMTAKFTGLELIEEAKGGPYAIFIAKFSDETAAKRFLEVQSKTLRTARTIARESEAKPALEITGPSKGFEQRMSELLGARALVIEACAAGDGNQ